MLYIYILYRAVSILRLASASDHVEMVITKDEESRLVTLMFICYFQYSHELNSFLGVVQHVQ